MTDWAKYEGVSVKKFSKSNESKRRSSVGSKQSICKAGVNRVWRVIGIRGRKEFTRVKVLGDENYKFVSKLHHWKWKAKVSIC